MPETIAVPSHDPLKSQFRFGRKIRISDNIGVIEPEVEILTSSAVSNTISFIARGMHWFNRTIELSYRSDQNKWEQTHPPCERGCPSKGYTIEFLPEYHHA